MRLWFLLLLVGGFSWSMGGPSYSQPEQVRLMGFDVVFDGKSYDASQDQTTFTYTVRGTGSPPDLSNFTLGFDSPGCINRSETLAFSPREAVDFGQDPNNKLYGIKWGQPLKVDQARTYAITFAGNMGMGPIRAAVKGPD